MSVGEPLPPILVLAGDRHVRQIIRWALEDDGLPVVTAAEPAEACRALVTQQPRLVIVDTPPREQEHTRLATALSAILDRAVPLLVIVAGPDAAAVAQRFSTRLFLHKPFDIDVLVGTVRRTLQQTAGA